jgi:hypothetical protein
VSAVRNTRTLYRAEPLPKRAKDQGLLTRSRVAIS